MKRTLDAPARRPRGSVQAEPSVTGKTIRTVLGDAAPKTSQVAAEIAPSAPLSEFPVAQPETPETPVEAGPTTFTKYRAALAQRSALLRDQSKMHLKESVRAFIESGTERFRSLPRWIKVSLGMSAGALIGAEAQDVGLNLHTFTGWPIAAGAPALGTQQYAYDALLKKRFERERDGQEPNWMHRNPGIASGLVGAASLAAFTAATVANKGPLAEYISNEWPWMREYLSPLLSERT